MLLTDARRPARTDARRRADPAGRAGPLRAGTAQLIARGRSALLAAALEQGASGEYQLQAAIAAVHDEGGPLRGHRLARDPRPLRPARADDRQPDGDAQPRDRRGDGRRPARPASRCSSRLDEPLAGHHRLHAVRAHLLELAGDTDAAIAELRGGRRAHHQRARAAVPDDAGGAPAAPSSRSTSSTKLAVQVEQPLEEAVDEQQVLAAVRQALGGLASVSSSRPRSSAMSSRSVATLSRVGCLAHEVGDQQPQQQLALDRREASPACARSRAAPRAPCR